MRLYLVQHGEANPKDVDPERGLTDKGVEDVGHIATFLKESGFHVNRVIHSGKLRAKQTAEIMAAALAEEGKLEVTDMINPNDPPAPFIQEIRELMTDTMVVGHLPFMSKMVSLLVAGDENHTVVSFEPGSIVSLHRGDDGRWSMAWMLRPELFGD